MNGAPAGHVTVSGRKLVARVRARRLRTISLDASVGGKSSGTLTVTLRARGRKLGTLAVSL